MKNLHNSCIYWKTLFQNLHLLPMCDVDFQDYINFICTLPGADENSVKDATSTPCLTKDDARTSDLNTPSITIANLVGYRKVKRVVTNVGSHRYGPKNAICGYSIFILCIPGFF